MNNNSILFPNQENSIFSNPYLKNNLSNQDSLAEAYKKLELLKQQTMGSQAGDKTVFTDIYSEWEGTSDDEKFYIENSKEYKDAYAEYQKSFNSFLVEYLGNDFTRSKYGLSAEKLLKTIKNKKEDYKNKFAEDIEAIKEMNSKLEKNNEELSKTNLILQEQLASIQKKLDGGSDGR